MSKEGSVGAGAASGSWASEALPLSVRKELLQRELSELRLRRGGSRCATGAEGGAQPQQQAQAPQHPQAGAAPGVGVGEP